ncbi:hypothetical protein PVAP13_9NG558600 [Panicum virgatum]|uniref:Uncharacterized protein n=1 Tax=Panicum virgatum TaxID=38727 RepID=A0A8T0MZU5_PANVG|nr:hypothetical protein PVAP13_9NG558600 [Panicum virgatum]
MRFRKSAAPACVVASRASVGRRPGPAKPEAAAGGAADRGRRPAAGTLAVSQLSSRFRSSLPPLPPPAYPPSNRRRHAGPRRSPPCRCSAGPAVRSRALIRRQLGGPGGRGRR